MTLVQTSSPRQVSDLEFQTKTVVNAIVDELSWINNEVETSAGSPPAASEGTATIRPTDPMGVDMEPGGTGGIGIQVDNTNAAENPVTHIVLWVKGADSETTISSDNYLRIAVAEADQSGEGDIFQAQFQSPKPSATARATKTRSRLPYGWRRWTVS